MATTKRRRKRNKTKDRLIVYSILGAFFLAGFFLGRITSHTFVENTMIEKAVYAATQEELVDEEMYREPLVAEAIEPIETVYFDIPLSEDIQDYIFQLADEEEIPASLIIAVIDHESGFNPDAVSGTSDYGLMQINSCNHEWLANEYGITNIFDPKQNILGGTKILAKLYHKYENPHRIAMSYNMGETGAKNAWESGITSTSYSESVVGKWLEYEAEFKEVQHGTQSNRSSSRSTI